MKKQKNIIIQSIGDAIFTILFVAAWVAFLAYYFYSNFKK